MKNKTAAILNLTEDNKYLKPLTNNRPIAALPFASRYRIIDFALSSIYHAGIDSVALFIGESGRSIYDHVRSGDSWHLDSSIRGGVFTFSHQNWKAEHHFDDESEDYYYNHRLYLERSRAEYVFVAGSKIIANVDINALRSNHIEVGRDVSLVYKNIPAEMVGPSHDNERVLEFGDNRQLVDLHNNDDYPSSDICSCSLNMYMVSVEFLLSLLDRALKEEQYLEIDDLIQYYMLDYTVNPYEFTGYTANIHSVQAYYQANMDMLNRQAFISLFHSSQPIITKSKNGVPAFYSVRSFARNSIIATGTKVFGEVIGSLVNRRVTIGENASVKNSILLQGSEIGEGARIEYAILDKNVTVEPGVQIIGSKNNIKVIAKNTIVRAQRG